VMQPCTFICSCKVVAHACLLLLRLYELNYITMQGGEEGGKRGGKQPERERCRSWHW
jgi:hypothetical protein